MNKKLINKICKILAVIFAIAAIVCFCTNHPAKGAGLCILAIISIIPKTGRWWTF